MFTIAAADMRPSLLPNANSDQGADRFGCETPSGAGLKIEVGISRWLRRKCETRPLRKCLRHSQEALNMKSLSQSQDIQERGGFGDDDQRVLDGGPATLAHGLPPQRSFARPPRAAFNHAGADLAMTPPSSLHHAPCLDDHLGIVTCSPVSPHLCVGSVHVSVFLCPVSIFPQRQASEA